jgi:hypothetical protein
MGGGRSVAFTLIPRNGVEGHTYSLHHTHGVPHVDCEDPCAVTRTYVLIGCAGDAWAEQGGGLPECRSAGAGAALVFFNLRSHAPPLSLLLLLLLYVCLLLSWVLLMCPCV